MKNKNCIYGFMDESGEPGIAKSPNDYFVVSIVLLSDMVAVKRCIGSIDKLRTRLGLQEDYEFHRKKNSPKNRAAFEVLMKDLQFRFITVSLKRDEFRKTATDAKMAVKLVNALAEYNSNIRVKMDQNLTLMRAINRELKRQGYRNIKFQDGSSHKDNLLQLADYVVNISSGYLKNRPKTRDVYKTIAQKSINGLDKNRDERYTRSS